MFKEVFAGILFLFGFVNMAFAINGPNATAKYKDYINNTCEYVMSEMYQIDDNSFNTWVSSKRHVKITAEQEFARLSFNSKYWYLIEHMIVDMYVEMQRVTELPSSEKKQYLLRVGNDICLRTYKDTDDDNDYLLPGKESQANYLTFMKETFTKLCDNATDVILSYRMGDFSEKSARAKLKTLLHEARDFKMINMTTRVFDNLFDIPVKKSEIVEEDHMVFLVMYSTYTAKPLKDRCGQEAGYIHFSN